MRYVYIVTRTVENPRGTPVPNLGAWSSLRAAERHFRNVVEDRLERGYKKLWGYVETNLSPDDRRVEVRRAALTKDREGLGELEILRIERWPI